jgi:hypothetical protein
MAQKSQKISRKRETIMNTRGLTRHLSILLIACAAFLLLLSACQPVNLPTSLPPVQPTATTLPAQPPAAPQPPSGASADFTIDLSGVAQDQTVETVAAVPASADRPYWEAAPQHRRVTLQGYPVTSHLLKQQIFIYPVADLAEFNEGAGRMATDLQALLQARQPVDRMPFLPLFNASQVMHAQAQYLDFKNGKGVRFLTQFDQAPLPVNNFELIYTFQGLTSDGKYYIAAVLPVTHPDLPATQQVSEQQAAELNDFPAYLTKTVAWLDQQPSDSFTPDLAKLDALIQSIEVK